MIQPKTLKNLFLLLITGALLCSGCSRNLVDFSEPQTTTITIAINNFKTQSFTNGTVNDISEAKITITQTADGSELVKDQALENHNGTWTAEFTLPINTELQFEINSFNNQDRKIFSGTTTKTLQITDSQISITQAAIEDGVTNLIPQILQITRPRAIGIPFNPITTISFTVSSAVTGNLTYQIIKSPQDPGSFTPETGTITINTIGENHTVDVSYHPQQSGEFIHEIKLTNRLNNSAIVEFNTFVLEAEIPAPVN